MGQVTHSGLDFMVMMRVLLGLTAVLVATWGLAAPAQSAPDTDAACTTMSEPSSACASQQISAMASIHNRERLERAQAAIDQGIAIVKGGSDVLGAQMAILTAVTEIASIYDDYGQFRAAEGHWRYAVSLAERIKGARSPELLNALAYLSHNLNAQQRWAEAETVARRGVEIEGAAGTGSIGESSISLRNNLAVALSELNRLDEAMTLSYALAETQFAKLGREFGVKRKDLDDIPALLRAHAGDPNMKALRDELFMTSVLLNNIGAILHDQGSDEAVEFIEHGARYSRALLPEWAIETAGRLNTLARIYDTIGRRDDALTSIQEARDAYLAALGPFHPRTSIAEADLGALQLVHLGDPVTALASFRRSISGLLANKDVGASNEAADRLQAHRYIFRNFVAAAWGAAHPAHAK